METDAKRQIGRARFDGLTVVFLLTTVLTSLSGFGFPLTIFYRPTRLGSYRWSCWRWQFQRATYFIWAAHWRWIYVVGASIALYLNVFVLVVQGFLKVPALKALAPTQFERPFLVAQLFVLLIFVGLTISAAKRFRVASARAA